MRKTKQIVLDGLAPPEPVKKSGIAAIMTKGGEEKRRDHDFYPTPWDGIEAFMRQRGKFLKQHFRDIWEPACGDGVISKVTRGHGIKTINTDLNNHGFGRSGFNFLEFDQPLARAIVTNPPYCDDLPEKFLRHARKIGVRYVAMLLKADYWNADCRRRLWDDLPPCAETPLAFRLDFTGQGKPHLNCTWWEWDWLEDGAQPCVKNPPLRRPSRIESRELFGGAG